MITHRDHFHGSDLEKIEAEMKKIVKENLEIRQYTMPRNEAIEYFKEKNEDYKVELIQDLPEDETISFYSQGPVRGPASDVYKTGEGVQADKPCRSLLEGRRAQHDAPKNLWYCVPEESGVRRVSDHDRGGKKA